MDYEDESRRAELRAAYVEAWESVASRALWAIGLLVCGVIAVLHGDAIGHLLGIIGLAFVWLVREPLREARRLRALLDEDPDDGRPGAN